MGTIIPLVAILSIFGIPLIAMLLKHQQRMAELMNAGHRVDPRVDALVSEVAILRDLVYRQTVALDRLNALPRADEPVQHRIGG